MTQTTILRWFVGVAALGLCLAGCVSDTASQQRTSDRAPAAPSAAPANRPDSTTPVAATVNGQPIPRDRLNDLLVQAYGLDMVRQLIADELVRQAAEAEGVSVTDADVQAENRRTLRELFGEAADESQMQRLLEQLLARKHISPVQWDLTMRRNALLQAIAAKRVEVTDEQLQHEYGDQYGRKYVVRHIQVESLSEAERLMKLAREGTDFAELARQFSKNPSAAQGGLLPPIGPVAPGLPPAIRQAARSMEHVGDLSNPVQVGTAFHVLKLEQIIEPRDVPFEQVRDELAQAVRQRQVRFLQQQILRDLFLQADIVYVDPTLKAQAAEGPNP